MDVPAGWYPDESTPELLRWWDGRAWTRHTRSGAPSAPVPPPLEPLPPVAPAALPPLPGVAPAPLDPAPAAPPAPPAPVQPQSPPAVGSPAPPAPAPSPVPGPPAPAPTMPVAAPPGTVPPGSVPPGAVQPGPPVAVPPGPPVGFPSGPPMGFPAAPAGTLPAAAPTTPARSGTKWVVALAALVVVGLLGAAGGFVALRSDGSSRPAPATTKGGGKGRTGTAGSGSVKVDAEQVSDWAHQIDKFWSRNLAGTGITKWQPLDDDAVFPTNDPRAARCGDQDVPAEARKGNAYYCPPDDYIAYDPELVAALADKVGPMAVVTVLAHETGHRVQAHQAAEMLFTPRPGVFSELMADCQAGTFAAKGRLRLGDEPLRDALYAEVVFGDARLADYDDQMAHGLAVDRTGAFLEGYRRGNQGCADVSKAMLEGQVQGIWSSVGDEGPLNLAEVLSTTTKSLNRSAETSGAPTLDRSKLREGTCADGTRPSDRRPFVACSSSEGIVYDSDAVAALYEDLGSFATQSALVTAYGRWVSPKAPDVLVDECAAGAFAKDRKDIEHVFGGEVVEISGEDLDSLTKAVVATSSDDDVARRLERLRDAVRGRPCS